jgi:hypothetical protein
MILNLTLNQEQLDALATATATANAALASGATPYTAESYLAHVTTKAVDSYVATAYVIAVERIGTAAAALPYVERQALIAQIKAQLP